MQIARILDSASPIVGLGAVRDGRLVGYRPCPLTHLSISRPTPVAYLQDLYTDASTRRRGVGRALILTVQQWSIDQGCSTLYWQTKAVNAGARLLYDSLAEHRGFVIYHLDPPAPSASAQ